jgi:hypothetical protein
MLIAAEFRASIRWLDFYFPLLDLFQNDVDVKKARANAN